MHTMFQSSGSQNGWSHDVYIIKITHDVFTAKNKKHEPPFYGLFCQCLKTI